VKKDSRKKSSKLTIPLDVLEPLQLLSNFEYRIDTDLQTLRTRSRSEQTDTDQEALISYRSLVRKVRADVDGQLRQRFHNCTEELKEATEAITRSNLAARVGDMDYNDYIKHIMPLRRKREYLERLKVNLKGWLSVEDRHMAGGHKDVKLKDVPCDGLRIDFPSPPKIGDDSSLIEISVDTLRMALQQRKKAEAHDLQARTAATKDNTQLAATDATMSRAKAAVDFCRSRLEQLDDDCVNEIRAIKAELNLIREKFQAEEMEKGAFQKQEVELVRCQSDITKARDLLRHALVADSVSRIPSVHGSFVKRLGQPARESGIGTDSYIAWLAAVLMILNIIVPIVRDKGSNMVLLGTFTIWLFVGATALALISAIARQGLRAMLLSTVWAMVCFGLSWCLQEALYSVRPVGTALREQSLSLMQPGVFLLFLSMLVAGLAAFVAILRASQRIALPFAVVLFVALGIGAIFSDFVGLRAAYPWMAEPRISTSDTEPGKYDISVTLSNKGSRPMWVGGKAPAHPTPLDFRVEEKMGTNSWLPHSATADYAEPSSAVRTTSSPVIRLNGGQSTVLRYVLGPGEYRLTLSSSKDAMGVGQNEDVNPLTLLPRENIGTSPDLDDQNEFNDDSGRTTVSAPEKVDVLLSGVVQAADESLLFKIELRFPNEEVEKRSLRLGSPVYGVWVAQEFNQKRNMLTLSNGERLLIFSPGESLSLDIISEEDDS
jgi:hypothetical protein